VAKLSVSIYNSIDKNVLEGHKRMRICTHSVVAPTTAIAAIVAIIASSNQRSTANVAMKYITITGTNISYII